MVFGNDHLYLLTDKYPFADCKNYDSIKSAIESKKLPVLPPNTPQTLRKIVENCWSYDPAARDLPKKIAESDSWSEIFKEASLQGSQEAKHIWTEAVKRLGLDSKEKAIPWEKFAPIFWELMAMNPDDHEKDKSPTAKCVKELMRVNKWGGALTLEGFTDFAKTFSPLRTGTEGSKYIKDMVSLCQQPWFYGLKGRNEVEAIFNSPEAKKLKNPFLLRLSDTQGYQFCFGLLLDGKITHTIVSPNSYEKVGYYQYFESDIKKKKLDPITKPTERPFTIFFDEKYKQLKLKAAGNVHHADTSSFLGWSSSASATGTGKFIT